MIEHISGWAMADPKVKEEYDRAYKEVDITQIEDFTKTPTYGRTLFSGTLKEGHTLTPLQIALIADYGNLCFGGYVEIIDNKFIGAYFND